MNFFSKKMKKNQNRLYGILNNMFIFVAVFRKKTKMNIHESF